MFKKYGVCREQEKDPLWRSRAFAPLIKDQDTLILSGNSNKELAEEVARRLGTTLGKMKSDKFADGENNIQIYDSVRGKDVFVIQPTCPPVQDNLIELLLILSTIRRTSAKKITAVIPYYGFARADRKSSARTPISAADTAKMLEAMGVNRVIFIDLHSSQTQGFFSPTTNVDNLESQLIMVEHMLSQGILKDLSKLVVVSPDAGGVYRAKCFADLIAIKTGPHVGLTMIVKQRIKANEVGTMELIGNVSGNDCIVVDDIIDTAGTLCHAADHLKKKGAAKIYAVATHGLFSANAIETIEKSCLEKVLVTNTIPRRNTSKKIEYISIGVIIAEAIRRIQNHESVSEMFPKLKENKKV